MTDRPSLGDLDAEPKPARWCCTGNAEDCPLCTDPNPPYPFICPEHPRTPENERIIGEATQATEGCKHEARVRELQRTVRQIMVGNRSAQGRLTEAHQVTIGQLRGAETRIRQLEERLRLTTDEKVANVVGPNIELLCEENARLRAEVAAARQFADQMRDFCSPHGVATDYADRLVEAMDRAKGDQ